MRSTLCCCKVNSTLQTVGQNHSHLDEVDSGGHRVDSTEVFSLIQAKLYGYESTLYSGCVDFMTLVLQRKSICQRDCEIWDNLEAVNQQFVEAVNQQFVEAVYQRLCDIRIWMLISVPMLHLQGIGVLLDGLFGTGIGSTVSIENVGLLGLTRVGSRRVVQISAGFMIFFSTLGKFGAIFASIPFPIFAALYCVFFGLVASVGLSFLQFTNMNSMRNLIITGLSLFLGISVPQYFNDSLVSSGHGPVYTRAGWFNGFLNTVFLSPPTVGLIVAVFLDNTLEVERSKKDRGMPWWVKFRTFRGDNRNEEFYSLPFNLNRFFPPT
ncbi:hypothetical protein Taro_049010 [Colocasia esculenta]|uniref:Uncharacterized protein n=1 Tax=Colocasia esculenta TaxID=4460 RepID=A0A843X9U1_COLES|nr:hypothetical protein [Colocasia esculenta]